VTGQVQVVLAAQLLAESLCASPVVAEVEAQGGATIGR
jgi:hypothetical protein